MSSTSAAPSPTNSSPLNSPQGSEGISLVAFLSALVTAFVVFAVQIIAFIILKEKLARIYKPKTYLVPERERTEPPPRTPWGWLTSLIGFTDREIINKCGLDAYFFLRYLQTLLVIFVPLAFFIIPILIPLNAKGGRGSDYPLEFPPEERGTSTTAAVTGLDQLAWGNIRPTRTNRYWTHLVLALCVIVWVCGVFFAELKVYIKVRQDYLTSAEHRLKASATTILVSSIPEKWLTTKALHGLYDVFPGGIRNIWINRNFDALLDKIHLRDDVFHKLEVAETELIVKAKKAQRKQAAKEEKEAARASKTKKMSRKERAQKEEQDNAEAERLAHSGGGASSGDQDQVPHTVDDAIDEEEKRSRQQNPGPKGAFGAPVLGGLAAVGQGIGKFGGTALGGVRTVGRGINDELETTNGFMDIDSRSVLNDSAYDEYGRYQGSTAGDAQYGAGAASTQQTHKQQSATSTRGTGDYNSHSGHQRDRGGRQDTRNGARIELTKRRGWWRFWEPPSGGFASPLPAGVEDGDEFPTNDKISSSDEQKGVWAKVTSLLSFSQKEECEPRVYPPASDPDYKEDAVGPMWQKFLKASDRPTHRIARFSWTPAFLPGLPFISPKVDTIYWCRGELARLNMEIEIDQKEPERFPLMSSAFIQFNHQVAAHMASQAVTHHVPKQMAPRSVEISPSDVIWDNMSIKWWEAWARTALVTIIVTGMIVLWTIPVGWTASLSQITSLANKYPWLSWLNRIDKQVLQAIAGVLPALVLSILLALVPVILRLLSLVQGAQTGVEQERSVQNYYFAFLFVQVFLVVSVTGGLAAIISSASDITSIPQTLATQLPKAANYFFSYMILQALSTSSGTLLQIATLILWFVLPKLFDSTPRQKWTRSTTLPSVSWGSYFPVYTNFACIALVYSVITPIIILFAIITFTLLWVANRYNMLYVSRFQRDTGGLLYPRAINQTFTGLYVMELALIGLFLLVRDQNGNATCVPHAIIMVIAGLGTVFYQFLLNWSFGPLLHHLPITFEDEAVIRDQAFEKAQARRLGLDAEDDESTGLQQNGNIGIQNSADIELSQMNTPGKLSKFNPINLAHGAGSWAARSGREIRSKTFGRDTDNDPKTPATPHSGNALLRRKRRRPDVEAQMKIADALYGGYSDEIEDLTPDERDALVRHAFQHYALRARRPTVWIPRDDIGVSDDEVRRTRDFAGLNIWISNVGAALDGKSKVVYGKNPPDFSEVDLINL